MNLEQLILKWLLMLSGLFLTCAFAAVLLPFGTMALLHQWLGLGELPDVPIVPYLARSTSVLYGAHGSLMFYTGLTIQQHARYVPIFGWLHIVIGITLLATDLLAPMPLLWTIAEGGPIAALGVVILVLAKRGAHSKNSVEPDPES